MGHKFIPLTYACNGKHAYVAGVSLPPHHYCNYCGHCIEPECTAYRSHELVQRHNAPRCEVCKEKHKYKRNHVHHFRKSGVPCAGAMNDLPPHAFCYECSCCVEPDCLFYNQYKHFPGYEMKYKVSNVREHFFIPHGKCKNTKLSSQEKHDKCVCGYCTLAGCTYYAPHDRRVIRTQKARGLFVLHDYARFKSLPDFRLLTTASSFWLVQKDSDLPAELTEAVFARPCPVRPRHGFVDSRLCTSIDELISVWNEAKAADPDAEMIVCSMIDAAHNAILTDTTITIGPGHDGATSGKDAIILPVTGKGLINADALPAFGITEAAYIELVYTKQSEVWPHATKAYITQVRNGPAIDCATADYVPVATTVTEIITVERDYNLLEWEALINSKELTKGCVVYHPGGSIASHYGVHCVLHKVPYITSKQPRIGDVLEPTKRSTIDFRDVREGLQLSLSTEYDRLLCNYRTQTAIHKQAERMLMLSLYALHGFAGLTKAESLLLGFAVGNLIRLSMAACLAELRHFEPIRRQQGCRNRHDVYIEYFTDAGRGLRKLRFAAEIFARGDWPRSYGGKAWASCTEATIELFNAAIRLFHRPHETQFTALIECFNTLVNCAHNNGLFLNKFAAEAAFNIAAQSNAAFAARYAAELYQQVRQLQHLYSTAKRPLKLVQSRLLSRKPYRKDAKLVESLLSSAESTCPRCGDLQSDCTCDRCDECGHVDCECAA